MAKKDGPEIRAGGRFQPVRVALLRLLYCKKQISEKNPYLSKALIQKVLFESQMGHLDPYLYDDEKSKTPSPLIETHPTQTTLFRIKNFDEMPSEVTDKITESFMIQSLSYWEKQIRKESEKYRSDIDSIERFVSFGLKILSGKFEEFFDKLSEKQLKELTDSLKNRKLSRGLLYRFISGIIPVEDDFETRLILDALMYCTYCFVLGQRLNNMKPNSDSSTSDYTDIVSKIVNLLMDSQGGDGGWAFRDYDKAYIAKDTGTILFLLAEINETFPNIRIDKTKLERSESFLVSVLQEMGKQEEKTIKMETEYFLQVSLYTTLQTIAGLYSVRKILGGKHLETFEEKPVKDFFQHLGNLQHRGGYRLEKDNEPDVETTSFIVNTLMGGNSFCLSDSEAKELTGNFSSLGTVNYFYNNRKTIEDFLNKGHHVNVVADCVTALLWCGIWPFSTYLTDRLVVACEKSTKYMNDFEKKELFKVKNNQISVSMGLRATYWKVMPAVHVLHQSTLCLMIMYQYLQDPTTYWSRMTPLIMGES